MEINTYRSTAFRMLHLIADVIDQQDSHTMRDIPTSDADISALMYVAKKHSLSAITAAALESHGIHSNQVTEAFASEARRSILMDREFVSLCDSLTQLQICHLPLKGIYLKSLYPKPWMREMSDIDILIESGTHETVKAMMLQKGYTVALFGKNNEDVYKKPPFFNIEMHRSLFDKERVPAIDSYFNHKEYAPAESNQYLWQMDPEDAYIYLIAHMYMHYTSGGCGLRSLLDIRLYLQRYSAEIDPLSIEAELKKINAADFEKEIRQLAFSFLQPEKMSPEAQKELDYYIFSGTYGTKRQYIRNRIKRVTAASPQNRLGYIRYRLRVPNNQLINHPFYIKHPKLKPLLSAARIVKAVIKKPKALLLESSELLNAEKPPRNM